jgi:oxalate decarboxylase/phosphoglucose isomerase-like protein (cupin superfamily)
MSYRTRLAPLVLAVAGGVLCATTALAQSAPVDIKASPEVYKVAAQNDEIMLVEATWAPGQRDQMHSHPAALFYWLTPCSLRLTSSDGSTSEANFPARRAGAQPPVAAHIVENIGKTECRVLMVEARPR